MVGAENEEMSSQQFGWASSDPEGKQHTTGFIMRQGLDTELIGKGKRRLKGLFEGDIIQKALSGISEELDLGPMASKGSVAGVMKCLSKSVNYNDPGVETVTFENFKYLFLVCVMMFLVSFIVLVLEVFMALERFVK